MDQKAIEQTKSIVLAAAKEMNRQKLVTSVWGNVSGRVPGTFEMVITPSGMDYEVLTEADLVTMNTRSMQIIDGVRKPSSESLMHAAIYNDRRDVNGVMHTHSTYASAFAVVREPIPPLVEDMAQVIGGPVPVADYALPGTSELGERVVDALGSGTAVLLANHGFVGVGSTLQEAIRVCLIIEKTAKIFTIARIVGNPHVLSREQVAYLREEYTERYGQRDESTKESL